MDEIVVRQLTRQLKLLNFWVSFFGIIFLACFVIAGIFAWKAVTELHKAENSLTSLQQKAQSDLDVEHQLCNASNNLSNLLKNSVSTCK